MAISILKDSVRLLEIQNQHIKTLRLLVNDDRDFEIDSTTKEATELIALFKEMHK